MAEAAQEAMHVRCHKLRLALFFSAMRHFRDGLRTRGIEVVYHELTANPAEDRGANFGAILRHDILTSMPERLIVVEPGDHRVKLALEAAAGAAGLDLEIRPDRHFLDTLPAFRAWADGKKTLTLETYYRQLRKRLNVLMDDTGQPVGGEWNFDEENRASFGKQGPPEDPPERRFEPDETTQVVLMMVEQRFADHPGSLADFSLPVTREHGLMWLDDFISRRLPWFGKYQDAMWTGGDFHFHSRLSFLLNLKLLDPRECINAAINAHDRGEAPINAVEGFVRQILGWREFTRGIYWLHMPGYLESNELRAEQPLPALYWNGETEMTCLRESMRNVLEHGYAHHIQRLMVLGLFAQLYGVNPREFHDWHMAMYLDAIDWVSAPNTIGMSQFADGGIVGTKPYCATGNYIDRMSNYCRHCRFDPKRASGKDACPFTTLYWDFLGRNIDAFRRNHRMGFQVKNHDRKNPDELAAIAARVDEVRAMCAV